MYHKILLNQTRLSLLPPGFWTGHLERTVGPDIWTGQLDRTFGPDIWTGHLDRTFGPDIWAGHLGRTFGPDIWTGHLDRTFGPDIWTGHLDRTYSKLFCLQKSACSTLNKMFNDAAPAADFIMSQRVIKKVGFRKS
jgi:hypothetical protein